MTAAQLWSARIGVAALTVYVTGLIYPLLFLPFDALHGDSVQGQIYLQFLAERDGPVHVAVSFITPLLAAASIPILWSARTGAIARTALVVTCVGVLGAWVLWYWLGVDSVGGNLWQSKPVEGIGTAEQFSSALHEFLGSAWKSLATLAGVLLGLQLK
jgi:hypothetical protein